ncbi:YdcF family protein [Solemya velum gill symbiont]|uniref:YdcF family protein n=1 Tax=Solemya velum gill symbiont TaxID=2340 RepID=UPI0015C2F01A|nr:YdcF family protein [Solemya velum gill symbiont]
MSKFLPLFVYPLGLAVTLLLLALYLLRRRRKRIATGLIMTAIFVLWIPSTAKFADTLLNSLERHYPPLSVERTETAGAIVVLGGHDAFDRLYQGIRLYRAKKSPLIIISGRGGVISDKKLMMQLLNELDVPESSLILESSSRNTRENGLNTATILKKMDLSRVILVTSAFHMKRALAVFASVGIEAIPAPTTSEQKLRSSELPLLDWLLSSRALEKSTFAIKEYIGLIAYRQLGWIE